MPHWFTVLMGGGGGGDLIVATPETNPCRTSGKGNGGRGGGKMCQVCRKTADIDMTGKGK